MHKLFYIFLTLTMLACNALDSAIVVSPFDSAVRINGRFAKEAAAQDTVVRTSFSGTSFTIAFEGTDVGILLKSPGNVFGVIVNGEEMPPLDLSNNNGEYHVLAKNLEKRIHVVTVAKRTESSQGDDIFRGFKIKGFSKKEALPPVPELKIEFLGNSITAGYGV